MKHSWPPGLPPTLATGRLPFPPHTTKNLWQDPKVPERWPCLEARSLADDDPFRVRAAGRCVSSSHLLSDTSGYASTACRFCSGSTVTFPFSWWPDLVGWRSCLHTQPFSFWPLPPSCTSGCSASPAVSGATLCREDSAIWARPSRSLTSSYFLSR
uniref:P2X purinoceptor 5 isoform X3 n=1 Tax=Sus scrofa TaxID=9823 RepID=A0A480IW00_PIG